MIDWPVKAPAAVADYAIDWSSRLAVGETLTGHTVTVTGATKDSDARTGNIVTVWLSGGVEGTLAKIVVRVTTSGGRTFEEMALLPIGGGPIDLARAKAHLRVDFDNEDALIAAYLAAAVGAVEKQTGRVLSPRALTQRFTGFPQRHERLTLWHDPVTAIVSVTYVDSNGAEIALDPAAYRSIEGEPWSLLPPLGGGFPATDYRPDAVRVRYMAGYAAGDCPPELQAAALMMLGHLYANRESVVTGTIATELPLGVKALCAPFRRVML